MTRNRIFARIGTAYLTDQLWFDPNPQTRTAPIPANHIDAISVLIHELGHAFVFNGWMDGTTGALPAAYMSTFDANANFEGTNFYFNGTGAQARYGRPVPLTFGNYGHIGNTAPRPGSDLLLDLMNGVVYYYQTRYFVSPLDLEITRDCGITIAPLTDQLSNVSTRLRVLTGDNALIGGFIVIGNAPKKVIVRAIGPSLSDFGVPGALANPVVELHGPGGFATITNDNWRDTQQAEIEATGIPPGNNLESAIVATLPPGAYTAIVRGQDNGTGVGLVEAYDLESAADAKLANISTRGFVDAGENVMIGGLIAGPQNAASSQMLVRAIGPSLSGVANSLQDPALELHNGNGALIASNDDWRDTQQAAIEATGIPPSNNKESAILFTFSPGSYTAIVRGVGNTTGWDWSKFTTCNRTPAPDENSETFMSRSAPLSASKQGKPMNPLNKSIKRTAIPKSNLLIAAQALSLALMAAMMPNRASAADGDLDPTFGTNGKVTTDFAGHLDLGNAAAVQSDGKIVVVGFTRVGSDTATEDFAIARYNRDGSLDSFFGTGGRVTTNFGQDDRAKAVAIRSDGKIIVAGSNSNVVIVAAYDSNGTHDTSIGASFGPCSGQCSLNAIAIQSDQKIVVAGRGLGTVAGTSDFFLIRFNTAGNGLDAGFGNSGFVQTDFFSRSDSVTGLVIQPADGKIVAGGVATTDASGSTNFALVRYNSDGSLDNMFGTGGKVTTDFPGQFEGIRALALQPDGGIVAAGFTFVTDSNFGLARYNANGSLDDNFGSGGKVVTDFSGTGATDEAHAVIVQPDGLIIAGGIVQTASNGLDFALARYSSNGSLDSNFGAGGKVTTTFSSGDDFVNALVLQADGQLVKLVAVGGDGNADFALARYATGLVGASGTLGNISTRLRVETGNNVLIGGFIVTGTQSKKVIVRAIGPSLPVAGALANPFLELRNSSGGLIRSNDNWRTDQEAEIIATTIPPSNDLESAIVETLPANNAAYTAIVSGVSNGTGIGLVEAYDLDRTVDSKLANISTRGLVQTEDNALIGGLIVLGQGPLRVIVRAIGPSLPVPGALGDPTLELRDGNGALIASNDNWRTDQEAEIIATTIAPSNDLESAVVRDLAPGSYTAIVRGVNSMTGVGLVEAYGLN